MNTTKLNEAHLQVSAEFAAQWATQLNDLLRGSVSPGLGGPNTIPKFLAEQRFTFREPRLAAALRDVILSAPKHEVLTAFNERVVQVELQANHFYVVHKVGLALANHGTRGPDAYNWTSIQLPTDAAARAQTLSAIAEQFWHGRTHVELVCVDDELYFEPWVAPYGVTSEAKKYETTDRCERWKKYAASGHRRVVVLEDRRSHHERAVALFNIGRELGRTIVLTEEAMEWLTQADQTFMFEVLRPDLVIIQNAAQIPAHTLKPFARNLIRDDLPVPFIIYTVDSLNPPTYQSTPEGPSDESEPMSLHPEYAHECHDITPTGDPSAEPEGFGLFEDFLDVCLSEFTVSIPLHHAKAVFHLYWHSPMAAREYIRRGSVEGWGPYPAGDFSLSDLAYRYLPSWDNEEANYDLTMGDFFEDIGDLPAPYDPTRWSSEDESSRR